MFNRQMMVKARMAVSFTRYFLSLLKNVPTRLNFWKKEAARVRFGLSIKSFCLKLRFCLKFSDYY